MVPEHSFGSLHFPPNDSSKMESKTGPASMMDASSILGRSSSPLRALRLNRRLSSQNPSLLSQEGVLAPVSCVTRHTAQDDCARQRFIVWAAVKRNSCSRMTATERLQCPLLRCRRLLESHEMMLRHLAECSHLPSGEYWCHEHGQAERFDDGRTSRCLNHPTKRRKVLSMAKNFFQNLGHKQRSKDVSFDMDYDIESPDSSRTYTPANMAPVTAGAELSATEICEIDSREVSPPNILVDGAINPKALLVPELDSHLSTHDQEVWLGPVDDAFTSSSTLDCTNQAPPRPACTTSRSKGLSPSSSVRSTTSTNSTDSNATTTSNVSSLVSPSSAWSGQWSLAASDATDITNAEEVFDVPACQSDQIMQTEAAVNMMAFPTTLSELPADYPAAAAALDYGFDPFLFPVEPTIPLDLTYPSHLDLAEEMGGSSSSASSVQRSDVCCSGLKNLVASAYDALGEHVTSSFHKLQRLPGNSLASILQLRPASSAALAGLGALRNALHGRLNPSAEEILCLVHLAYALSLVLHEGEAESRANQLFLQALAYRIHVTPEERPFYLQIVTEIWQPLGISQDVVDRCFCEGLSRSEDSSDQPFHDNRPLDFRLEDAVMATAHHFLDAVETALLFNEAPASLDFQSSELYNQHLRDFSLAPAITTPNFGVSRAISKLKEHFRSVPALDTRLAAVASDVHSGHILSVRRFELELLRAAKGCVASSLYFDAYVPLVTRICDRVYALSGDAEVSRRSYHRLGLALIQRLLPTNRHMMAEEAIPAQRSADLASSSRLLLQEDKTTQFLDSGLINFHLNEASRSENLFAALSAQGVDYLEESARQDSQDNDAAGPEAAFEPSGSQAAEPSTSKAEADACCELCGYRPKGDPQWFRGSMAKHKKLQHSDIPPKVYKCPYPGCKSSFQKRPDNLRQHQIEKNHFVGEETTSRRPSKRKRQASPSPADK